MGLLVDGKWQDRGYDTKASGGRFVRSQSVFRDWVTPDGAPGPSGTGGFEAASGRYHLYVSLACPWAHRTLIMRKLKGLEAHISVDVVDHLMLEEGWTFETRLAGATGDTVNGKARLYEVYQAADPGYTGRVTVPTLWDKVRGTIVSNESSEIIRMFNSAFDALPGVDASRDFYPDAARAEIDAINQRVYDAINNGVYRSGFATTQDAYLEAVTTLFEALDEVEARLAGSRFLVGDDLTEGDIRLYPTLVRFDPVYVGHFKCNLRRIADYPNLQSYLRDLYQRPAFRETTDFDHIKRHYYESHRSINPTGIVPKGPILDLDRPHGRERLAA